MRGAAQSHYVVRAGQTPAGLMRVVAMLATTAIAQSLKATDSPSQPGSANSPDLGLAINQGSRLSMLASLVPALTSASTELSVSCLCCSSVCSHSHTLPLCRDRGARWHEK